MQPFILTLKLDAESFACFNALRQQHFPRERNYLDAHLTLFHALPAAAQTTLRGDLDELAARTPPIELHYPGLRFLGHGTAIEVQAPDLMQLRRELRDRWHPLLGAQDKRNIAPHVTIQNKVAPNLAHALFDELSDSWRPFAGRGEGFSLWRYRGGPWEAAGEWTFEGASI